MAGFKRLPDGSIGQAELMMGDGGGDGDGGRSTRPGDALVEVDGAVVSDMSFDKVRRGVLPKTICSYIVIFLTTASRMVPTLRAIWGMCAPSTIPAGSTSISSGLCAVAGHCNTLIVYCSFLFCRPELRI